MTDQPIRKEFTRRLGKRVEGIGRKQRSEIVGQIHWLSQSLLDQGRTMILDEPSQAHLRLCVTVLASYQIVSSYIEDEANVLELIQVVFRGINKRLMGVYTSLLLRFSLNLFQNMIRVSRNWLERSHGDTFSFQIAGDEEREFSITVEKSFFYDYF